MTEAARILSIMCLLAAWGGCSSGPGDDQDSDAGGDVVADDAAGETADPGSDDGTADKGRDGQDVAADDEGADAEDEAPPEFDCSAPEGYVNPAPGSTGHTEIAHWKGDRPAALTISFDDSTPNQLLIAMPAMIARGFTGTYFVNPGTSSYQIHQDEWETVAPANFQELANHTMDHTGATDYSDAEYQIGEAAGIITSAYPASRSPLMGFNNGGGTTWNITDEEYQALLVEYHCIERLYSSGVYAATPGDTIFNDTKDHLSSGGVADNWGLMHFHGICDPADTVNCVCDTPGSTANCREYGGSVNNGSVKSTDFVAFLDALVADSYFAQDVWIAGFISTHKYQSERNSSGVVMVPDTGDRIALCLSSTLDPALYDESLTLITQVPAGWTGCSTVQGGAAGNCIITEGTAVFDALPDRGAVVLSQE